MLKAIRNALVASRPAQSGIRVASRKRLLPRSVYRRLPPIGAHPVTSPAGNEFTYIADVTDPLARSVVWDNLSTWERGSLEAFSHLARSAERFIDVGAYTGVYSLIACIDGPGEAIAFEPNPAILPLLQANIEANNLADRVDVVAKGASNAPGKAYLSIPADTTAAKVDHLSDGPSIELTTVDDVLAGRKADVMKIDVEGLEPLVLEGASRTLERWKPNLIVECLSVEAFTDLQRFLHPLGYRSCKHLAPDGPHPTDEKVDMRGHANYLWTTGT